MKYKVTLTRHRPETLEVTLEGPDDLSRLQLFKAADAIYDLVEYDEAFEDSWEPDDAGSPLVGDHAVRAGHASADPQFVARVDGGYIDVRPAGQDDEATDTDTGDADDD